MNTNLMSGTKVLTLFGLTSLVIHFSNWMAYNGKTRIVMNAKYAKIKSVGFKQNVLFAIPFVALIFSYILLQSL